MRIQVILVEPFFCLNYFGVNLADLYEMSLKLELYRIQRDSSIGLPKMWRHIFSLITSFDSKNICEHLYFILDTMAQNLVIFVRIDHILLTQPFLINLVTNSFPREFLSVFYLLLKSLVFSGDNFMLLLHDFVP